MCMENDINIILGDLGYHETATPHIEDEDKESQQYKLEEELIPPKIENIATNRFSNTHNTLIRRVTQDEWELLD